MKMLSVALLLACAGALHAQPASPTPSPSPTGAAASPRGVSVPHAPADEEHRIRSSSDTADPMFGIRARAVGLERIVHVLQWHPNAGAPSGYDQEWASERIGPEGLDSAHANPTEFPINGQRWWSQDATLDGHPLSTGVLTALEADADARKTWWTIKPDPSQLPPNLAVTFQPDGMLLTTSQDNAHPQVGDVRVQWRVIADAPAPAGLRLVGGRWEMPDKSAVAAASPTASGKVPPPSSTTAMDDAKAWLQRMFGTGAGWLVVAGIALALVVLALRGRRRTGSRSGRRRK
ncbi:MAG TPA: TMEM43 family protein [Xanthomonadaceae bacterium]|jgi:hypothetical protein